jgi:hypothetical protein
MFIQRVRHYRSSDATLAFRVNITGPALDEAREYLRLIDDRSNDKEPGRNWWAGLNEAILSLESLPGRCQRIPEQRHFKFDLHQLVYASHRIIFGIEPRVVTIYRIYHGSRKPLKTLRSGMSHKR